MAGSSTEMIVGTTDELDVRAMRAALPADVYTDAVLKTENYIPSEAEWGEGEKESYADYVRGLRIVETCTADDLATLIDRGLVGNHEAFETDEDRFGKYQLSLLEHVMPDVDKMRVCLEHHLLHAAAQKEIRRPESRLVPLHTMDA